MVGKVKGLDPNVGVLRIRGVVQMHFNTKYQKWVVRRWQPPVPVRSKKQLANSAQFKAITRLIKFAAAEDVGAATITTKNSPLLVRDQLMRNAVGTGWVMIDNEGSLWEGVRVAFKDIQGLLNSLTDIKGSLIVYDGTQWIGFNPNGTTAGQVLTSNGPGQVPTYENAAGGGLVSVTGTDGVDAVTVADAVTLALSTIADGMVLANLSGVTAVPVATAIADLLDVLGAVEGDMLVRGASGWEALPVGSAGQLMASDGTDAYWATIGSGGISTEPSIQGLIQAPAHPGFDALLTSTTTWTLSSNNRHAVAASGGPYNHIFGSPGRYTGKLYFEVQLGSTSFAAVGVCGSLGRFRDGGNTGAGNFGSGSIASQIGWASGGGVQTPQSVNGGAGTIASIQGYSSGQRLCIAMDIDARLIWFRTTSGNWNNSGAADPATGVGGINAAATMNGSSNLLVFPGLNTGNTSGADMYLLAADFTQTVPTGFTAWGA